MSTFATLEQVACGDLAERTARRLGGGAQHEALHGAREELSLVVEGLRASAHSGRPAELAAAALAAARADSDPAAGYRRTMRLLDALCGEAADTLKRALEPAAARVAVRGLRYLLGPAMAGLTAVMLPSQELLRPIERPVGAV